MIQTADFSNYPSIGSTLVGIGLAAATMKIANEYAKDNPGDVVGTFLHVLKKFAKIALIITGVIVGIIVILFIILLIIGYMMNF